MTVYYDVIGQSPSGRQNELNLLFYGKEDCLPGHSWGPGLRDSYLLHYIHSGSGVYSSGEETYRLTAGEGFLIVPGTLVSYKADEDDPWSYSWVGFKGLQAASLLRQASLDAGQPIFRLAQPDFFETVHDKLSERSSGRDVRSQSLLYGLMADLIDSHSPAPHKAEPSAVKQRYIRQAVEYMETNYSQKISVLAIARFVGLDRTYLSSLFKEKYGVSLQLYLLQFRISRAQELLMRTDLSVSDVSRSVGYTDPFLFSKMFKRVTGVSPRQARTSKQV